MDVSEATWLDTLARFDTEQRWAWKDYQDQRVAEDRAAVESFKRHKPRRQRPI